MYAEETLAFRCEVDNFEITYDKSKIIILPCCGNFTCVSCAKANIMNKFGLYYCRICKSNLYKGQSAQSYRDKTLSARIKIRRKYGLNIKYILSALDLYSL